MFLAGLDLNCTIELCDPARQYFAGAIDEFWQAGICAVDRALAVDDVSALRGEFKVKWFSCPDQFLCMAFAQLTFRESLRDIEAKG